MCTDILHFPARVLVANAQERAAVASTGMLDRVLPQRCDRTTTPAAAPLQPDALGSVACTVHTVASSTGHVSQLADRLSHRRARRAASGIAVALPRCG